MLADGNGDTSGGQGDEKKSGDKDFDHGRDNFNFMIKNLGRKAYKGVLRF